MKCPECENIVLDADYDEFLEMCEGCAEDLERWAETGASAGQMAEDGE